MHRLILGLDFGNKIQGDHKDRNKLNNRRNNLRLATYALNGQNQKPQTKTSSQYRGVAWCKRANKWKAYCKLNGVNHCLGSYTNEEEANNIVVEWRKQRMIYSTD